MEYQDEMVEMGPQEAKGREETLVCRGHLAFKVAAIQADCMCILARNTRLIKLSVCSMTMMNILRTTIVLLLIADLKYSHSLFCPAFCNR